MFQIINQSLLEEREARFMWMMSKRVVFYKRLFFVVALYNFLAVIIGIVFPFFLPFQPKTDQGGAILSLLLIGIFVMGVGAMFLALNPLQNYAMAVVILLTKIAGVLFAFWTVYVTSIFSARYFYLSLINDLIWIPFVLIYVVQERDQLLNLIQ